MTVRFRCKQVSIEGRFLIQAPKANQPFDPASPGRRKFLVQFCQGASVTFLPAGLRGFAFPRFGSPNSAIPISSDAEFHLHPHYRSPGPLDAVLAKTQPGLDEFVTEKYHDQIAAILGEWGVSLQHSPREVAFERTFAADFLGSSLQPTDSQLVRTGAKIEVRRNKFSLRPEIPREAFLHELRYELSSFSKILTAEFQVTSIEAIPATSSSQVPEKLQTRVRYELVGTGDGFYREQRVGTWNLEWKPAPGAGFQLCNWQTLDETRSRSLSPSFIDTTASAFGGNASYSRQLLRGVDYWRTALDGACGIDIYGHNGVSVADIDNDGFDDLYVCQPAGLPNRLYRNRGDGTFEDITEVSGLGLLDNTSCALFADFDNDGRQDVVVVTASGPQLFLNRGGGKFRGKPGAFHFANPPQGTFTGAAVADYDRDGWLDIYFCLYLYYQGANQYKYPLPYHAAENGPPNFMMRNQRDGTFRDVTAESGLNQNNARYSFCCSWGDYNRDGWPDLYVVNDFGRKNLYRNNGDGTFTDVAAEAGVEDVGAGMSVCWFDYDNDGAEDLYVADMWTAAGERISEQEIFKKDSPEQVRALYRKHAMGNSLFHYAGREFQDETSAAGVGVGRWSWSSDAFDFDHDGFADLYIANGMISGVSRQDLNSFFWRQVVAASPDRAHPSALYEQGWNAINELVRTDGTWSGYERNVFYANNRDGTFSDISGAAGVDFIEDGRSFALVDFDHDGRQEIFLKNRNAPQLRLLKNVIEDLPPSIVFRLRGTKSNRDAIGAVITIETETGRQTRKLQAGSGFLAQHSKEIFFGLGETKGPVRASIQWPSGLAQELTDLPANHRISVEEGSDNIQLKAFKKEPSRGKAADVLPPIDEQFPRTIETWLLAPMLAPDFTLNDLTGRPRILSALRGKPLLLNFWSMQCPDSLKNLAALDRVFDKWTAQGLQLFTVCVDESPDQEKLLAFVRKEHFSFPIAHASDDVAAVYNIVYRYTFDRHRDLGLPTSFLIDEQGKIVKVYQGLLRENTEQDSRVIPRTNSQRLERSLPFPGVAETFEVGRNYLSYGSIFFQRGYFEQAGESFQQALRDDPSSAEAAYGLGSTYLNQQKIAEARENFELATKLQASYPDTLPNAWNNLGLLAAKEGASDEAVRCFRQAVQLAPDHLIELNNLGNAYRLQKNWPAARETFAHALDIDARDPEANYGLAMVFAQADDTASAYEYLRRALQLRPDYPEALNNLAILYLRTQRRNDAVENFQHCIRVAPKFDQAYLNLARVYSIEGAPTKAREILLQLLEQVPGNKPAQVMLSQLPR